MADIKEEKKTAVVDDKRYAIITRESIKMMAESVGISELCDEAAAMLCEDVSYRLKEATQVLYRRIRQKDVYFFIHVDIIYYIHLFG